jgi:hypothetical protein
MWIPLSAFDYGAAGDGMQGEIPLAALLYLLLRYLSLRFGITKEWCICVGEKVQLVAIPQPASVMELQIASKPM